MFQDMEFTCALGHLFNMDTSVPEAEWDMEVTNTFLSSTSGGFFETAFEFLDQGEFLLLKFFSKI